MSFPNRSRGAGQSLRPPRPNGRDKWASATFLASVLDVPAGPQWGPFVPVKVGNGVTLDYMDANGFESHHCAFLTSEAEFDAAFACIRSAGITYYADPHHERPDEINHLWGGRGVYFDDPDGHNMEIITQPYGEAPARENVRPKV